MFEIITNLLRVLTHPDADEDKLVEVSLEEKPYRPASPDYILCVDAHQNENALKTTIEYAHQIFDPKPGTYIRFAPRLFALINFRKLSPNQLFMVNEELIPTGASIFPYPNDCNSFTEAKNALREQLAIARRDYSAARKKNKTETPSPVLPIPVGRSFAAHAETPRPASMTTSMED